MDQDRVAGGALDKYADRGARLPQLMDTLTQARLHPGAQALIARRRANGDGGLEALRILKRRLSDVVYRALLADATLNQQLAA